MEKKKLIVRGAAKGKKFVKATIGPRKTKAEIKALGKAGKILVQFRLTPTLHSALKEVAERERRSLTNMAEIIMSDFMATQKIGVK